MHVNQNLKRNVTCAYMTSQGLSKTTSKMKSSTKLSIILIASSTLAFLIYLCRKRYIEIKQDPRDAEGVASGSSLSTDRRDSSSSSDSSDSSSDDDDDEEDDIFIEDEDDIDIVWPRDASVKEFSNKYVTSRNRPDTPIARHTDGFDDDVSLLKQISSPVVNTLPTGTDNQANNNTVGAQAVVCTYEQQTKKKKDNAPTYVHNVIQNILSTYHDSNTPNSPNTKKYIGLDHASS